MQAAKSRARNHSFDQTVVGGAVLLTVGSMLTALFISGLTGTELRMFLRDWAAITKLPWYYASLELAGALSLAGTAAVLLFSATMAPTRWRMCLLGFGLFTGWLCIDDLFMVHEKATLVGLGESTVFLGYLICLAVLLVRFRLLLVDTRIWIFAAAIALLGAAALLDELQAFLPLGFLASAPTEELLELLAFNLWAAYFVITAHAALAEAGLAAGVRDRPIRPAKDWPQVGDSGSRAFGLSRTS